MNNTLLFFSNDAMGIQTNSIQAFYQQFGECVNVMDDNSTTNLKLIFL